ncbi:unnamed protein product [Tuber melanosporum]|uniref:(Perigord truffle) hypothetical protein n=1 Tax=Tuber melanosporum (strain Mel28) TaxID=656061 RepID=D5G9S3_TUBMM|nr:uncharacterized protein GSTUM_00005049001 [Tuber melanosporum]CAZ81266.1 unnamed protein product [Tuber melanosporum]
MDIILTTMMTMMDIYSKIIANFSSQPKEPIKLYLPTHEMCWKIPYQRKAHLANEIDQILKGIQQTHATVKRKRAYMASTTTFGIGMPSPGGWVLVDLRDSSLVHKTYLESLIYPGGEYVVLCMGSTEIPRQLVMPYRAGERGQIEDEDEDGVYVDAEGGEDIGQPA